jgi:predicted ABC-type ATPase
MQQNPHVLTVEENRTIFLKEIVPAFFRHAAQLKMPEHHVVGAQPGSGKSTLIREITNDLKKQFGNDAAVSIIGDKFRAFHPDYNKLLETNPYHAGDYTHTDLSRWVQQAVDFTAQQGNCVVIEGTLREPEVNIRTASQYIKHGFTAHLHVLAVHEFVSRVRIFRRYFDQDENSSQGRYTPLEAHDRSYKVLPESIAALVDSSLFKTVALYDQEQNSICNVSLQEKDAKQNVLAVLGKYRDNKNVDTAAVLLVIDRLLPQAKQHGGRIYSDLQELQKTVLSI